MQSLLEDSSEIPEVNFQHQEQKTFQKTLATRWQHILDSSSIHVNGRWVLFLFFLAIYSYRVYMLEGFYIVTYGLGIYLLNLLIGFLSPLDESDLNDEYLGPSEYRPFQRRLSEFKAWYASFKAVIVALFLTFFSVFDVPVFWPILVLYFIVLFAFTMKRQIQHMIKHRYVPFSIGKKSYPAGTGKEDYRSN